MVDAAETPPAPAFVKSRLMHCDDAQRLFDAYLDGELSPSLATELGAHRLQCPDCRRALALLEVSEHILTLDQDSVSLPAKFTDRLVACVDESPHSWRRKFGRWFYIGGPLAAAAVIALAFVGMFDGRDGQEVAGDRVVATLDDLVNMQGQGVPAAREVDGSDQDHPLQDAQRSFELKKRSMESLQKAFDLTLQQPLDLLEQSQKGGAAGSPASEAVPRPSAVQPSGPKKPTDELEDL